MANFTKVFFILLIPVFVIVSCIQTDSDSPEPICSNQTGSLYLHYNKTTYSFDSVIFVKKNGKEFRLKFDEALMGKYPRLYKDKIISLTHGFYHSNFCLFDPETTHLDTICHEIQFLSTCPIDEYENHVVIREYNKFAIIDMTRKKILKEYNCELNNILLLDSIYYFVRTKDNISEPRPYLCKGQLNGYDELKMCDLPGEIALEHYSDATTQGWNGMTLVDDVLFISGMKKLFAYDILNNKILDAIDQSFGPDFYQNKKENPKFVYDTKQVVFNLKTKKFEL